MPERSNKGSLYHLTHLVGVSDDVDIRWERDRSRVFLSIYGGVNSLTISDDPAVLVAALRRWAQQIEDGDGR